MEYNSNFKIICCTSINKKILENYAKPNIESFIECIPQNFKITIFSEEKFNKQISVKFDYLFEKYEKAKLFINSHKNNPKKYNLNFLVKAYQTNYIKFCFKIFTMIKASRLYSDYDFMFWIDADIFIKKKLDIEILRILFNKDYFCSYLNRELVKRKYPINSETGILVFNLKNKFTIKFFSFLEDLYFSGNLFKLPAWCDASAFDFSRMIFEKNFGTKFNKLTSGESRFPLYENKILNEYFFHPMGEDKLNKKLY